MKIRVLGMLSAVLWAACSNTAQAQPQCTADELVRVIALDNAAGDHFGRSVVVDGYTAVISADRSTDAGTGTGSAYVFHFDGTHWIQQAKLLASDAAPSSFFGASIAIGRAKATSCLPAKSMQTVPSRCHVQPSADVPVLIR